MPLAPAILFSSIILTRVTSIVGDYAFGCCSGLASLPIASGVKSIGVGVFQFCSGLTVKNVFFSASDQALEVLHIASNSSTWVQYKQVCT